MIARHYARPILSTLAALLAAGASSFSATSFANPPDKDAPAPAAAPAEKEPVQADDSAAAKSADPADADDEHDTKAGAHKGKHGHAKPHAKKAGKAHHGKTASAGRDASQREPSSNAKPKKTKKTASREGSKKKASKKGDAKAPPRPCLGPAIALDRGGLEAETLPLLDCHGAPRDEALEHLSVLARPWGVARPARLVHAAKKHHAAAAGSPHTPAADPPEDVAAGIRMLDPGLLARIDVLARKFEGRTVSLVSGYRPQSQGSLHQTGKAVDLRITGVGNAEVVAFCRTLADTGCGYYPNSSFVHVDVRTPGTGGVYWIDASGPGEAPRYVSEWPPAAESNPPPAPVVVPPADVAPYEAFGLGADTRPHGATLHPALETAPLR